MMETDLEGGSGSALRSSLVRLLPLLLIMMLVAGIGMFGAISVLPHWRTYEQLTAQRDAAQQALDEQRSQQSQNPLAVLEGQIESASARLNEAAGAFVSPHEADDILDRLYAYAHDSAVEIIHLEALDTQPDARNAESEEAAESAPAYELRAFRLYLVGEMRGLMDFVIHVREASIAGVMMSHLDISQEEEQTALMFELTIYASPYASGQVFADLPAASLPPSPTPMLPTATPSPETTPVGETMVNVTPAAAPVLPECPNAPPTFFAVGDTAVVDFNDAGALRILAAVGPSIDVLAQAYDNQVLSLAGRAGVRPVARAKYLVLVC